MLWSLARSERDEANEKKTLWEQGKAVAYKHPEWGMVFLYDQREHNGYKTVRVVGIGGCNTDTWEEFVGIDEWEARLGARGWRRLVRRQILSRCVHRWPPASTLALAWHKVEGLSPRWPA